MIEGSGIEYEISPHLDKIPPYDSRSGNHFWVIPVAYRVNPVNYTDNNTQIHLDKENLVLVAGVGCFYCEQIYKPLLLKRRCPGRSD